MLSTPEILRVLSPSWLPNPLINCQPRVTKRLCRQLVSRMSSLGGGRPSWFLWILSELGLAAEGLMGKVAQ